ncbi:MAG: imidazole glycerol phosphate synthase subunit HisH [Candidatus Bathyarchaeota archaeon]|nr:imidazole glycerol phosphate synthase subunit HisH [Candidatus Bathyarchaeota archaeon]
MPKVAIIDYGAGNLFSIRWALKRLGLDEGISSTPQGLRGVDAIVLPGVGNFKAASRNIGSLRPVVGRLIEEGVPLFDVCLGLQLLFQASEEGPGEGLGIFRGRVLRIPGHVKTPHMGWNTLRLIRYNEILDGVDAGDHFYFVHSYYACPEDEHVIVAETNYGLRFPSVVAEGNIFGTQFHPEKSGKLGEQILRKFARIVKR